jgi:hypothetical protein
MQNLRLDSPAGQTEKQRRPALPYAALDVRSPICDSYSGKRCRSSKKRLLRYPHIQRLQLDADLYRSQVRLEILNRVRKVSRQSAAGLGPCLFLGERVFARPVEAACERP